MRWEVYCYRDLVLAVFRLAVCDYLGVRYGHDEPVSIQRVSDHRSDAAAAFLVSPQAHEFGELINVPADLIWKRARQLRPH